MSQSAERQFCSPLFLDPFGNGEGDQKELNQRETPRPQVTRQCEEFNSFRGSAIKGFKHKRKMHKGIPHVASTTEINSCASTESPLSLTPRTLEIQICDSEDELDLGTEKPTVFLK